jgi:hypothetical protein
MIKERGKSWWSSSLPTATEAVGPDRHLRADAPAVALTAGLLMADESSLWSSRSPCRVPDIRYARETACLAIRLLVGVEQLRRVSMSPRLKAS